MKGKSIEVGVGLFMLAGLLALVVLAFNVSGLRLSDSHDTYRIYAVFENIGGLTVRSKVTIAGVMIGRVSAIDLDRDTFSGVVEMVVDAQYDNLSTDTTAAILTAGLLGEKYIGLVTGADEAYLRDGSMIEDTQSSLVLEELIGQFLFNKVNE